VAVSSRTNKLMVHPWLRIRILLARPTAPGTDKKNLKRETWHMAATRAWKPHHFVSYGSDPICRNFCLMISAHPAPNQTRRFRVFETCNVLVDTWLSPTNALLCVSGILLCKSLSAHSLIVATMFPTMFPNDYVLMAYICADTGVSSAWHEVEQ